MGNKLIIFLTILLLIVLFITPIVYHQYFDDFDEKRVNAIKNPITSTFDTWGDVYNNSNQIGFSFWIQNYADTEIKNITVKCKIFDIKDNVIFSQTKNIGNIASNSMKYDTVYFDDIYKKNADEQTGTCFIYSCNDCDILWKRIDYYKEIYQEEK